MPYMDEKSRQPEDVGSTITVRLDSRTDNELAALVKHFNEQDTLGRRTSLSQVVRAAIREMHAKHLPTLAILLVVMGALACVPSAQARMVTNQQRIALFTPIAEAIHPPNCNPVRVTITDDMTQDGRVAEAGTRMTAEVFATAGPDLCTIKIKPWVGEWDDALFCQILVHEYGHLAGHDHADTGIMRSDSDITHMLPACVAAVESTLNDRDRIDTEFGGEATAVKKIKRATRAYRKGVRYTLRSDDERVLVYGTGLKLRYVYPSSDALRVSA